ncbi:MAG: HAD hydrolase family protein [Gemmatimonadaceae bacterium]|jgi:mannosyl-3-phosphoglycerate phosphatase|nr:HAD hydrolase family protein [Gemmatimonadaceae bacterium]
MPASPRRPGAVRPDDSAIIISDVDGTLFDDGGWAAPPGELRALMGTRPLVLASSRTVRELIVLQHTLGMRGPVIAENGAVVAFDAPTDDGLTRPRVIGRRTVHVRRLGQSTPIVRSLLAEAAREAGVVVLPADRIDPARRALRGIASHGAVRRALEAREASVLLEPLALSISARLRWHQALAERGVQLSTGGRWACAVSGADKGRAARLVRHVLASTMAEPVTTMGLGNDANDAALLAAVDRPIAVRRADGRVHPSLLAVDDVVVCQRPGIGGALDALRAQLGATPAGPA